MDAHTRKRDERRREDLGEPEEETKKVREETNLRKKKDVDKGRQKKENRSETPSKGPISQVDPASRRTVGTPPGKKKVCNKKGKTKKGTKKEWDVINL